MKKKLALMLCLLLAICMLGACGEDPKTVDYNGKSYDEVLAETAQGAILIVNYLQYEKAQQITDEILTNLKQNGFQPHIDAAATWDELESQYGACDYIRSENFSLDDINEKDIFQINKAGNTLTADLTLKFGEKDVIFELVYDYYDMSVKSVNLNPVQTMGEKMTSAGQNTIISLAIVFFVLILISLIIKGFVIFPMIEEKKKNKNKVSEVTPLAETNTTAEPEVTENLMDDTELIAVIAAAIAASEGTSTSDFVVRSINRR